MPVDRLNELVRVWTDVGARKPVPLLAKIEEIDGVIFTIRYLSETEDRVWRFEDDTYEIDDESIAEYMNTTRPEDVGFAPVGDDGFVRVDTDDDYVPGSDEEDETEDEESLCESSDEMDESDQDDEAESEAESEESLGEE